MDTIQKEMEMDTEMDMEMYMQKIPHWDTSVCWRANDPIPS